MTKPEPNFSVLKDFIRTFLMPTLVGKMFIYFFGLKYSENPGEGYGYGLVASIVFTLSMIGLFLWKYRNVDDP